MSEVLDAPVIETKIAEYSATAAALADLQHRFKNVVFDLSTTKGEKEARTARQELVKLRGTLEAKRQEIKAPALERSRLIDAEAKRIASVILELEEPIDAQIKQAEAKREAERQAKAEAERRRIEAIRDRIARMPSVALRAVGRDSEDIEAKIALIVGLPIGAEYAEFQAEAEQVRTDTLATLRELHAKAMAAEQEAARLQAEREELARQRAAQERQDAEDRARLAAERQAEEVRQAAARKAEEDRVATERAKFAAEQRAQREAQAKLDREAAEARAEADRKAQAERDEQDRIARDTREAEETRLAAERADLKRKQDEQDRIEREDQEAKRLQEELRRNAEMLRERRLHAAAGAMLDALRKWASAEMSDDSAALQSARMARDEAIKLATGVKVQDAGAEEGDPK